MSILECMLRALNWCCQNPVGYNDIELESTLLPIVTRWYLKQALESKNTEWIIVYSMGMDDAGKR